MTKYKNFYFLITPRPDPHAACHGISRIMARPAASTGGANIMDTVKHKYHLWYTVECYANAVYQVSANRLERIRISYIECLRRMALMFIDLLHKTADTSYQDLYWLCKFTADAIEKQLLGTAIKEQD